MIEGTYVNTPRFLAVKIAKVFNNMQEAFDAGYFEPTGYEDHLGYRVYGHHIGPNLMVFASVRPKAPADPLSNPT